MKQLRFNPDRIIYDLCGGTGSWSQPYFEAGYTVRLIDTKNGADVRTLTQPSEPVHGILAAPPCTHFAKVGNRWWAKKDADGRTIKDIAVMDACIRFIYLSNPIWWCLENPSGRMSSYLGPPVASFHPYHYGTPYKKQTCLWGNFKMPPKNSVEPIPAKSNENSIDRYIQDIRGLTLTMENRAELRSMTPPGFAKAFFQANP